MIELLAISSSSVGQTNVKSADKRKIQTTFNDKNGKKPPHHDDRVYKWFAIRQIW